MKEPGLPKLTPNNPVEDPHKGSPLRKSQQMKAMADVHEQENESYNLPGATLPKSVQKVQNNNKKLNIEFTKDNLDYTPENPEFDFESVKASPHFKVKTLPEAVYMGEIQNGVRHGLGVMRYNSGRVYEGEWVDDTR